MEKRCPACGTVLAEGILICPRCGTAIPAAETKEKKSGRVPVGLIVLLSVALVLVFAGYVAVTWLRCGNPLDLVGANMALLRYGSVAKEFVDMEELKPNDVVRLLKKVAPKQYLEEISNDWKDDAKDLVEDYEDEIDEGLDEMRDDDDFKDYADVLKDLKVKVVAVDSLPKNDDAYDEFEDRYGFEPGKIATAVLAVSAELDGDEASGTIALPVIRVNGKWYYWGNLPSVKDAREMLKEAK